MLHTLTMSPFRCDVPAIRRLIAVGDHVLLLEDGVIFALAGTKTLSILINSSAYIYALRVDLLARGLMSRVSSQVEIISYTDFVMLVLENPQQVSW
ncbi:sulfurtransferase complex subunit TusB [Candidatus Erwinia haradaeae]|uniref:Protein TusB n=1 Tax=Candidatus Erwinia haradaeae TaxID=1922217 RepID=A0A451D7U5_9GAMM|nr:sulfurtransferase complex subunit TusB [Candidatus Erwinia haradaeae]VFP81920.1 Protein TusB [Candidatus Erwinia haradaeae]